MKNQKPLIFVLPIIMLVMMACNLGINFRAVRGSGTLQTEERTVSGFDKVSLAGMGELRIVQGDEESLTIEAEDNLLEYITTEVRGSELHIGIREGTNILPTKGIYFNLAVRDLNAIAVSGAGNIKADSLNTGDFNLSVSGAGNINIQELKAARLNVQSSGTGNYELSGVVDSQNVSISGAGNYRAGDLESSDTNLTISGAGNATLWAKDSLTVKISGFGKVDYYGDPNVNEDISGGGSINHLGDR